MSLGSPESAARDLSRVRVAQVSSRPPGLASHDARRRHAILEHASPVLGSGLGKTGQAGDPWIVTRARPGALGGADFSRG